MTNRVDARISLRHPPSLHMQTYSAHKVKHLLRAIHTTRRAFPRTTHHPRATRTRVVRALRQRIRTFTTTFVTRSEKCTGFVTHDAYGNAPKMTAACPAKKTFRAPTFFRFARGTARNEHTSASRALRRYTRGAPRRTRQSDSSSSLATPNATFARFVSNVTRSEVGRQVRARSSSRRRRVVPPRAFARRASARQYEARDKVPGFGW